MKNKIIAICCSVVIGLPIVLSSAAFGSGESSSSLPMPGKGYFGIEAIPGFLNSFSNSALLGKVAVGDSLKEVYACTSFADPTCKNANFWQAYSMFPACLSDSQNDCIQEITATNEDGTALEVKVGEKFPGIGSQDFNGDPALSLAPGLQTSIYRIPGAPHAGGDTYLPIINPWTTLDQRYNKNNKTFTGTFQAALFAVSIKSGNFQTQYDVFSTDVARYPRVEWNTGNAMNAGDGCIMNDATLCAVPVELPMNIRFGIKIRTSVVLKSWFSGRLNNPAIDIKLDSQGRQILSVSANPVGVPALSKWVKKDQLSKELLDFYDKLPKPLGGTGDHGSLQQGAAETWSLMRNITNYDEMMMKEFVLWLPHVGDKASFTPTMWSFRTINSGATNSFCIGGGSEVKGFVSTNATMYIDGPPTFDQKEQSLQYKVAATHFDEKGDLFKGTYDLAIKSDAARCLYGFTNAPISAKIEVVSESGLNQVAVTTVNERNGWLYLSAKGFTFSAPVVNVRLTQEKVAVAPSPTPSASPTPTPMASASAAPVAAKKTSITCLKGKTSKKVTAVNPTCPKGYKKK
jgi:hypothetical protein